MMDRDKIAARLRALRAMTVENGCTEAEAMAAAEMLAKLLEQYNMSMDEADVRASPFDKRSLIRDDFVGEKLWVVADGISKLTGARYWGSRPSEPHKITFFGFAHEVDVASYLLDICAGAMARELRALYQREQYPRERYMALSKKRRLARPFIDGMSERLRQRLMKMIPLTPPGTELVVLRNSLVDQAMKDAGLKLNDGHAHMGMAAFKGYNDGMNAADRVALNPGLAAERGETLRLK